MDRLGKLFTVVGGGSLTNGGHTKTLEHEGEEKGIRVHRGMPKAFRGEEGRNKLR